MIVRRSANIWHQCRAGSHTLSGVVIDGNVTINERGSIGLGTIFRDGIVIPERCFIGAEAVVVADILPNEGYRGNPAPVQTNITSLDATKLTNRTRRYVLGKMASID